MVLPIMLLKHPVGNPVGDKLHRTAVKLVYHFACQFRFSVVHKTFVKAGDTVYPG